MVAACGHACGHFTAESVSHKTRSSLVGLGARAGQNTSVSCSHLQPKSGESRGVHRHAVGDGQGQTGPTQPSSQQQTSSHASSRAPPAGGDVAARARRHRSQRAEVVAAQQAPPPAPSGGVSPVAMLGVAGLAGSAVLLFMYRQVILAKAQAMLAASKAGEGAEPAKAPTGDTSAKHLQQNAVSRLNDFSDRLRNTSSVSLSAQNLGEEGTAYVVEALAFNAGCLSLDLSQNGLGKMAVAALCQVLPTSAVQTLVLNTNSVGDEGAELLAKTLSGNRLLQSLDLGQNGIGDKGAAALAEGLRLNTTLTKLELAGNAIDVEGTKALAQVLGDNTSIRTVNLGDNYVGTQGALALAQALIGNTTIKELDMRGHEMGDEGWLAICDALQSRECEIIALDLGNNSMTDVGGAAVARLMHAKRSLREVNLYMNDIGDAGVAKLAPALRENKSLTTLDLGGNAISPMGARSLAAGLKGHTKLRSLELGYNPLEAEGTQAIVDVVKFDLKALDTLRLGWCKLGTGGARAVADLLLMTSSSSTVSVLDLRGNSFGNDGAIILARGFKEADGKRLAELDLGYNEIKDEGACAIAQALKANANNAPVDLRLNSNYITRFGQVALAEAVDMVFEMGGGKRTAVHF